MAGVRPITDTLVAVRNGALLDELSTALNKLVGEMTSTGKPGSLTLTLAFKPHKSGAIDIADDVKVKSPKEERGTTLMFATPEGNLQRNDPRQGELPGLRKVDNSNEEPVRRIDTESGEVIRGAATAA